MKKYKLKQVTEVQRAYLRHVSVGNVIRRAYGFPEIELELHDWFEEDTTPFMDGEIADIEVNGSLMMRYDIY